MHSLDSLMIILGHHCVAILVAKMLVWTYFSQSMSTFSICINPCDDRKHVKLEAVKYIVLIYSYSRINIALYNHQA